MEYRQVNSFRMTIVGSNANFTFMIFTIGKFAPIYRNKYTVPYITYPKAKLLLFEWQLKLKMHKCFFFESTCAFLYQLPNVFSKATHNSSFIIWFISDINLLL